MARTLADNIMGTGIDAATANVIANAIKKAAEDGAANAPVQSVNGKTGAVVIDASDIQGLPTAANPTASIGVTAKNGSASSFMRSDAAPAIDLSITPTWGSLHTFAAGALIGGSSPTLFFGSATGTTRPMLKAVDDQLYVEVADGSRLTAINAQAYLQGYMMPHAGTIAFPEYTSFDYDKSGMTFQSDTQWSLVLNAKETVRVDTTVSNQLQLLIPGEMRLLWGTTQGEIDTPTIGLMSFQGGLLALGDFIDAPKYQVASTGAYTWGATSSQILSPSNGIIRLANAAGTDFLRLQFGGTTSAFPSLKRNAAAMESRLADDSNFAVFRVATPVAVNDATTMAYVDGRTGNATTSVRGVVLQGIAVADAAGANPTKAEFDALLASLRTSGVLTT